MKRRVKLLVLVIGIGVIGVALLWPREPVHRGRGLSSWLRDFEAEQPERQAAAEDALRHMGSKAVPFLIERLKSPNPALRRDSMVMKWKRKLLELLSKQSVIKFSITRPEDARRQALAGLDALGPEAKDALPGLENLLHEDPPDPQSLYVVARIGAPGIPLLRKSLTNEVKVLRLEARICLDMMESHSATLYPKPEAGADFASFNRRICEFNVKVLGAAAQQYRATHPDSFPSELTAPPPTVLSPTDIEALRRSWTNASIPTVPKLRPSAPGVK